MRKVPQPKWLGDFFLYLYLLGFANCQLVLYISNVAGYYTYAYL